MAWIQEHLDYFLTDKKLTQGVVPHLQLILETLFDHYGEASWVIHGLSTCVWEDNCVVVQWSGVERLVLFVYPAEVQIHDSVEVSHGQFTHTEKCVSFASESDYCQRFICAFDHMVQSWGV